MKQALVLIVVVITIAIGVRVLMPKTDPEPTRISHLSNCDELRGEAAKATAEQKAATSDDARQKAVTHLQAANDRIAGLHCDK